MANLPENNTYSTDNSSSIPNLGSILKSISEFASKNLASVTNNAVGQQNAPAPTPAPVATPPPISAEPAAGQYFQALDPNSGAFIGISNQTDPWSGRPYFAYQLPGQATTTDTTRVAPMTNPFIAAPTPRTDFENPRLPYSASEGARSNMNMTPEQQLDHSIALALGGSNDPSNLAPISTLANQTAGQNETTWSGDVNKGNMSLFQAQSDEAAVKGISQPWTDNSVKPDQNLTPYTSYTTDNSKQITGSVNGVHPFLGNNVITNPGTPAQGPQAPTTSRLFKQDYNIPLWLGGDTSTQNTEQLDAVQYAQKQAAQAVPYTLYSNGKISLDQAKLMALNWQSYDTSKVPTPDASGHIPLDDAQKISAQWTAHEANPEPANFTNIMKALPQAMQNFGQGWLPGPLREFAKGLVGGVTANIMPGTGVSSDDQNFFDQVANIGGNVAGTIAGLGLLAGVPEMVGAGAEGVKAMLGFGKVMDAADEALQAVGAVNTAATDVGSMTKSMATMQAMAKSAGLLGIWGQIGLTGREMTGQQQVSFSNHLKQAAGDILYGGLAPVFGQGLKGYAGVAASTAAISLMQGNNIQDSLKNAVVMSAMHMMGGGELNQIAQNEAYKGAVNTFNQYLGDDVMPTIKKGESVGAPITLDTNKIDQMRQDMQAANPNDLHTGSVGPIQNQADAADFLTRAALSKLGDQITTAKEPIPQETIDAEITRIGTAGNELYKQTLDPKLRIQKSMEDTWSLGEKLKPQTDPKTLKSGAGDLPSLTENAPLRTNGTYSIPEGVDASKLPTGTIPVTGYAGNIDSTAKANVENYDKNPDITSNRIYFVKDPRTNSIMKLVNYDNLSKGKTPMINDPEDTLATYYNQDSAGGRESKRMGYAAQEERIGSRKYNFNENYENMVQRLKTTVTKAKSADDLYTALNKDQSKPTITPEEANELFAQKTAVPKMSSEDFMSKLKATNALQKFDMNLNNGLISKAMDANGLTVLPADVQKITRTKSGEPFVAASISPNHWAEAFALRDGKFETKSPWDNEQSTGVQKAIEDVKAKAKTKQVSSSVGNALKVATTLAPTEEDILKPGESPVSQSTHPSEFTPEEIKTLKKQGFTDAVIAKMNAQVKMPTSEFQNSVIFPDETPKTIPDVSEFNPVPEKPATTPDLATRLAAAVPKPVETSNVPSSVETKPTEASGPVKTSAIQGLVDSGKLTQQEAAPLLRNEVRINELNDAAAQRPLTQEELTEQRTLGKQIKQTLIGKGLMKDSVAVSKAIGPDANVMNQAKKDLLNETLLNAQDKMENIKMGESIKSPQQFKAALIDAAQGARTAIEGSKIKLNSDETKLLLSDFDTKANAMAEAYTEAAFDRDAYGQNETPEEKTQGTPKFNLDQQMMKKYGIASNSNGFLDPTKKMSFDPDYVKENKISTGETPSSYWKSSIFDNDMKSLISSKTIHSSQFVKDLDEAAGSNSDYAKGFSATLKKGLEEIFVNNKSPYIQKMMGGDPANSFELNAMLKDRSLFMRNAMQTLNEQGHYISQPSERILKMAGGASPETLKALDTQTTAEEATEAEDKSNAALRGENPTSETEGKDLGNMHIMPASQAEKIQDLTKMEAYFMPGLIKSEITGEAPTAEDGAKDAVRVAKDIFSKYKANLASKGKDSSDIKITTSQWNNIVDSVIKQQQPQ